MKKGLLIMTVLVMQFILCPRLGHCESADEQFEQYNKQYEALKPPAYSSVNSDYVFEQTALAAREATKILQLIYEQNRELLSRYDEALNKYDEIIRQNNEILKLLSKNNSKDESKK